jgi:hypothetical protein
LVGLPKDVAPAGSPQRELMQRSRREKVCKDEARISGNPVKLLEDPANGASREPPLNPSIDSISLNERLRERCGVRSQLLDEITASR